MKIDHVAFIVKNINEAAEFYSKKLNMECAYKDSNWAILKNEYIKLALVLKGDHPNHVAILCSCIEDMPKDKKIKEHRDGSLYCYEVGPSGNAIEWIYYP